MPTISVILPVHNVERYLSHCLDSLLAQTFSDWEAICVDDGSTDGTPEVLDRYAAADPRIRAFHRSNAGVSAVRNFAITQAAGEYVFFLDSDDFVHPQLMELCLYLIRRDGSDLVCYTNNNRWRNRMRRRQRRRLDDYVIPRFKEYDPARVKTLTVSNIFDWISGYPVRAYLRHGKWVVKHCRSTKALYRRELVADIVWEDLRIFEDVPWWAEVLLRIRKTTILNLPLYFYYPNDRGAVLSTDLVRRRDCLQQAIAMTRDLFAKKGTPVQQAVWEREFVVPFQYRLQRLEKRLEKRRRQGAL